MYLSVCSLTLHPPPSVEGGGPSRGRQRMSSLSLSSVSLSRASTLAFLNLNSGMRACVQTPLPQFACMRGCPPIHTSGGGSLHTHAFPNSGIRNARILSLSHIIYIYIYIYNPLCCNALFHALRHTLWSLALMYRRLSKKL